MLWQTAVHHAVADDTGSEWALVYSLSHQTTAQQAEQWDSLTLFGPTSSSCSSSQILEAATAYRRFGGV
jgi:hypothetical protein